MDIYFLKAFSVYCKIKKNKDSITYSYVDGNDRNLDIFRIFLTEDVGHKEIAEFKEWALDEKEDFMAVGHTWIEKEKNKVYIHCDWHREQLDPPKAELSIEEFVSGLNQWEKLIKFDPKYITIKKENDRITIKGSHS